MDKTRLVSLGAVYIYIYISRLLEKINDKIKKINIYEKIMVKPKIGKI